VKTFSYADNKGTISSVPVGIGITIKLEGIDSLSHVLYSGSVNVASVTGPTMDVIIEANQVTPIAPSDLVAQALSFNTIRLIWKENSTNETGYLVSRQTNGSTTWDSLGIAAQNTFTDSTLAPVTQYQYRVIALNAAGRSAATTPAVATTLIMDKTGPSVTVASFKKIDTVNTHTVTLYGTAHDTSGIYQVMLNNVVAQLSGDQWTTQNFYLADTVDTIIVKATDNSPFKNFTVDTLTLIYKPAYVDTANHRPMFTVSVDSLKATIKVGQAYLKTLKGFDSDVNDTISFVVSSPLSLLGKDTVYWLPKAADIGLKACYALVYDKKQAHDSISWTITVLDSSTPIPNHPPAFVTRVSEILDSVGQNWQYLDTLVASDQDAGQILTFSIVTGPAGLAIGGATGIVTWTPTDTSTGNVVARVTDDSGAHAEIAWKIRVVPAIVKGPVTDADGNVYDTIVIGTQTWMKQNLKTTKYSDNTSIPYVPGNTAWSALTGPGYCWYNNDSVNKQNYGAFYNWYAIDTKKLAPVGWHVPTASDWSTLINSLGGWAVAGGKMKATGTTYWNAPNTNATNESGFTALPGGYRSETDGTCYGLGKYAYWWFSDTARTQKILYTDSTVVNDLSSKLSGCSIRCLRN
jgi:Fibronectin type III domain./Fibrobacter succinogenes major domain (Fib_succ_major).